MKLDGVGLRAAEALRPIGDRAVRRVAGWWQRASGTWRHRNLPGDTSRHPVVRELAALDRGAPGWQARALRLALRGNAYETAAQLAAEVDPRAALPLVLETWLAHGERERATALARAHRAELEGSLGGAGLLEVLDLGPTPNVIGSAPNPLAIRRAVEQGALVGADVERLLAAHPAALLRHPDRHLLAHDAHLRGDPAAADAALGRCLRAFGLPPRSRPPRPVTGGPLVSVLVAAHDSEKTIEASIDSLLAQSYQQLEILVGDDASVDGTLARLARYHDIARVRVFRSAKNQGPYNLRNALLEHARGELVTFHDADDVSLPTRIATQVRRLRTTRDVVASYTCFLRVTPAGRFVFFRDQAAIRLCMVTLMIAPERLRALGGFRPAGFGADLEIHQRLLHAHGPAAIDVAREPLLFALWNPSSVTRRRGSEAREDGYRAPARRAYAELVFQRMLRGDAAVSDEVIDEVLRAGGNLREPVSIEPA